MRILLQNKQKLCLHWDVLAKKSLSNDALWGRSVREACWLRATWRLAEGPLACFSARILFLSQHYIYQESGAMLSHISLFYISQLDPEPTAVKWSQNTSVEIRLYSGVGFER